MNQRPTIILLLLLGFLVGCSSVQPIESPSELSTKVVRMDRDGSLLDLKGKKIGIEAFKKNQLAEIKSAICADDCDNTTIAIYVHGAPLVRKVGEQEIRQKLRAMQSTNPYWYPIVFNWQGSLGDVYADHLLRVRNGRRVSAGQDH